LSEVVMTGERTVKRQVRLKAEKQDDTNVFSFMFLLHWLKYLLEDNVTWFVLKVKIGTGGVTQVVKRL
jgi:hypothetical protein